MREELAGLDLGKGANVAILSPIFSGASAGLSHSKTVNLLSRAGAIEASGGIAAGTAVSEVLLPLLAGVAIGRVLDVLLLRATDKPTEEACDAEWAEAIAYCEEKIKEWRTAPQGVTGGYTNVLDCAAGNVSEACGGNKVDYSKKKKGGGRRTLH